MVPLQQLFTVNIPLISQVYSECHANSVAHCLNRADDRVMAAMNATITREESYRRKSYGNIESAVIATNAVTAATGGKWDHVKENIKQIVTTKFQCHWMEKIKSLVVQGKFLALLAEEKSDISWRSIVYNMPKKILSFAVRASIDCLPTFNNLHRWGKKLSSKCKLCGNTQTLHHVLNGCTTMLDQNRYTWRHNNILNHIFQTCHLSSIMDTLSIYVNLPGHATKYHSTKCIMYARPS